MERKRKKKKGKRRERKVSRNVRGNLLRALYICTYYIRYREVVVWLSHAFKFVCRNGSEAAVNAERYTIRR